MNRIECYEHSDRGLIPRRGSNTCGIDIWVLSLTVYQGKRVRVSYTAPIFKGLYGILGTIS